MLLGRRLDVRVASPSFSYYVPLDTFLQSRRQRVPTQVCRTDLRPQLFPYDPRRSSVEGREHSMVGYMRTKIDLREAASDVEDADVIEAVDLAVIYDPLVLSRRSSYYCRSFRAWSFGCSESRRGTAAADYTMFRCRPAMDSPY
ncbi:hypothetical protein HBH64_148070 [Parastagonospora nodorum]|nr:hypothetical protein HBI01_023420 [Parastagonospora nodorum]KAH4315751.1 hypothetical protein HBI02_056810 [Parastagonospora nodorum]KAH4338137.1 hypothetical protein HBI00_000330 [Parastagonospora nodorum]KAH4386791.1 hypothetical protein HBH94_045310 [Parastagonospora nodorum]KAH4471245.1 hypothetical protein HBH90_066180 [Parastagonospora nodorum]